MPDKNILKCCYMCNPDGCGFVSESDYYRSLDFDRFCNRLSKVPKGDNCIIHFRFATHGSVKASNCHPFYDSATGTYFAHNGVLPIKTVNDRTDSEMCFRKQILPRLKMYGFDSAKFDMYVNIVRFGTRFAIMHDGRVKMYGDFETINGVYYSNLRWLR